MITKLKVKTETRTMLYELEKGDWFSYRMPDDSSVIAIRSDETIYHGEKISCMRIKPGCGTIAHINKNEPVKVIELVSIDLRME